MRNHGLRHNDTVAAPVYTAPMRGFWRISALLGLVGIWLLSTIPVAGVPKERTYKFADIQGILKRHCVSCHIGPAAADGVKLDTYENVMRGGDKGKILVPFRPEKSRVLKLMKGSLKPIMPPSDPKVSNADIAKFYEWIRQGAKK